MTVQFRTGTVADVPAAARLWNAQLGRDFPLAERILALTVFEDPTFLPGDCLAAVDDEQLVAFAWRKRGRGPVGYVGGIVVRAEHQRQGIASTLLRHLESGLAREGSACVEVSGGLLHLLPGCPEQATAARSFFEQHGYIFDETHVDLTHDLAVYESPRGLPAASVGVADDSAALLEFLARSFAGGWEAHARWHLGAGGEARDFIVLEVEGRIEGFCHIFRPGAWPPGPSTYWSPALQAPAGGLGPIGVSEALRGHGLGRRVLDASLLELKSSGVRGCAIDWTRLVNFYGAFGFMPWRVYARAHKQLGPH